MGGGRGGWGRGGASGRSPVCCCWSHSAGRHAGGLNCSSGRTDRKRGRESRGEAVSRLWGPALSSGRDSVSAASSLFLTWAGPFRASASYLYNESGGGVSLCSLEPQGHTAARGPQFPLLQPQNPTFNCPVLETSAYYLSSTPSDWLALMA